MSLYDYRESQDIEAKKYSFYSLIMAAMRQADDNNLVNLRFIYPSLYQELKERYNAPGGLIGKEIE